ncbi:hypothetical protein [Neobacillus sp. SAB-20_R2A]|uniref:hypothetical protein n=1 Tax=Neobacillus sp. SAB-20_R2A TaxID=3120519 RepID=UPI003C6DDEA7
MKQIHIHFGNSILAKTLNSPLILFLLYLKVFIVKHLLIGAEGTKTPAGVRGRGDPAGAKRRGGSAARPRKAKCQECQSTDLLKRLNINNIETIGVSLKKEK